jgi:hypothetical protein
VKPVLLNLGVSVLHFFIENPWVLAQIKVTISGKGTFLFNAGDLADCCCQEGGPASRCLLLPAGVDMVRSSYIHFVIRSTQWLVKYFCRENQSLIPMWVFTTNPMSLFSQG